MGVFYREKDGQAFAMIVGTVIKVLFNPFSEKRIT